MLLTLSSESVRNTIFTNESGQVLYKTSHPFKIGTMGTTTIHKIAPNADPTDMRDKFDVMGEIDWRLFGSSTFRINGEEMQTNDFLPRHGITGRCVVLFLLTICRIGRVHVCASCSKRTFTGPDDRPYRWDMLFDVVVVSTNDVKVGFALSRPCSCPGTTGQKRRSQDITGAPLASLVPKRSLVWTSILM